MTRAPGGSGPVIAGCRECVCTICGDGHGWLANERGEGVELGVCWRGLGIGCGERTAAGSADGGDRTWMSCCGDIG